MSIGPSALERFLIHGDGRGIAIRLEGGLIVGKGGLDGLFRIVKDVDVPGRARGGCRLVQNRRSGHMTVRVPVPGDQPENVTFEFA
jgi:hypothetical protein